MTIIDAQIHVWNADTPSRPWPPGRAAYAHGRSLSAEEVLRVNPAQKCHGPFSGHSSEASSGCGRRTPDAVGRRRRRNAALCRSYPVAVGLGDDSRAAERPKCQDRSHAAPSRGVPRPDRGRLGRRDRGDCAGSLRPLREGAIDRANPNVGCSVALDILGGPASRVAWSWVVAPMTCGSCVLLERHPRRGARRSWNGRVGGDPHSYPFARMQATYRA